MEYSYCNDYAFQQYNTLNYLKEQKMIIVLPSARQNKITQKDPDAYLCNFTDLPDLEETSVMLLTYAARRSTKLLPQLKVTAICNIHI
jgi:hypothetical protein